VARGGLRCEIPAEELVPGDIALLQSGDKVPADLRLIEARSLRIQEAALTDESEESEKSAERVFTVGGAGYAPHGGFSLHEAAAPCDDYPELIEIGRACLLCNDSQLRRQGDQWTVEGDPTEGALLALAMKAGLDPVFETEALSRSDVIPFEKVPKRRRKW